MRPAEAEKHPPSDPKREFGAAEHRPKSELHGKSNTHENQTNNYPSSQIGTIKKVLRSSSRNAKEKICSNTSRGRSTKELSDELFITTKGRCNHTNCQNCGLRKAERHFFRLFHCLAQWDYSKP